MLCLVATYLVELLRETPRCQVLGAFALSGGYISYTLVYPAHV